MKIILLEDDPNFVTVFTEVVNSDLAKRGNVDLVLYKTEHAFMEALPNLSVDPEDAFVLDIMVRWTDPQREMPEPPANVKHEGYQRAGLRCQKAIRNRGLENKIILLTVLESGDLIEEIREFDINTKYLNKEECHTAISMISNNKD